MPETESNHDLNQHTDVLRDTSENLGATIHPLLPEWMEGYKWANDNYPQINLAIHIAAANSLLKSFQKMEVDWMYAAHSGFSDEQFAEIKSILNQRHRAFGIERYPKEHIRKGEEPFAIQDQRIRDIWTNMVNGVGFTFLDFAGGWDPENNLGHKKIIENQEPYTPSEADNQFITNFLGDEANEEKVVQLTALYATAEAALRLPATKSLAARRKAEFNRRRTVTPVDNTRNPTIGEYPVPYIGLIRQAVTKQLKDRAATKALWTESP